MYILKNVILMFLSAHLSLSLTHRCMNSWSTAYNYINVVLKVYSKLHTLCLTALSSSAHIQYNREDLLTFISPPYLPTQTHISATSHVLFQSPSIPIPALHPVFPRLSLKKRQCLLICQSDVVLVWRWWGSVTVGHTPPAACSLEQLDD